VIEVKSEQELAAMREAGRIVAIAHSEVKKAIVPGVTTQELDVIVERVIRDAGASPSFKGYHGFPASICSSVNDEVVHGIPGLRKLCDGDVISIDIGAYYKGFHGDSAWSYAVGNASDEAIRLLEVTEASLFEGIRQAVVGNRLTDISHAVQAYVEPLGHSVVRDYVGHGIGREMHEDPSVPNFGAPGKGPRLKAGMVLAIEPMVNAGGYEVKTLRDNWTVVTVDGSLSAHFEHTVAITEGGPQILTQM
jgi:methionyl aminopeptidase